ncbi:hypothetical protein JZO70_07850 [Enterococcus sp. 669A]|uniref:Uncharacterized protein n=1 Tax=Candidatus Enterococcus moelleringii TaxID=2815325 RepID=A0ABS3L8W9_9ENTE|nr:hypothetical protein [Enterococcus sp. 669A]MBO1306070.1 hypothetical protein [Enterococcus sp. 669A]
MSKELKKILIIKIIQYSIFGISLTAVIVRDRSLSNWPFYLMIIGILLANLVPIKYRSNFSSTDPGLFLKNHTRHLENIIDMTINCLVIFLVTVIDILKNI